MFTGYRRLIPVPPCVDVATINSFLVAAWWMMKVVQNSVPGKWRADLTVTIEKLAIMDVSNRQIAEFTLSQVVVTAGMILFAAMGVRSGFDEKGTNIIGLCGALATFFVLMSEVFTTYQALDRKEAHDNVSQARSSKTNEKRRPRARTSGPAIRRTSDTGGGGSRSSGGSTLSEGDMRANSGSLAPKISRHSSPFGSSGSSGLQSSQSTFQDTERKRATTIFYLPRVASSKDIVVEKCSKFFGESHTHCVGDKLYNKGF